MKDDGSDVGGVILQVIDRAEKGIFAALLSKRYLPV
jgi:hypothetical protein